MITKLDYFKKKLLEEKVKLEDNLKELARRNPENPEDWQPTSPEMNVMVSDKNELADTFEELENRLGVTGQLEQRLNEVNKSLELIKDGEYGKCSVCKKEIGEKRLEANITATTCVKHILET